jgi:NAD(P)-dependent dehydrogenase (short-subunit alcohol dehydrogenase family)
VVVGASGAIGGALAQALAASGRYAAVIATGRRLLPSPGAGIVPLRADVTDPATLAALAAQVAATGTLRRVIVASGVLHDGPRLQPEKHWGQIDPAALARAFAVNATGPALVARHLLPLVPRTGRSEFAALSARVGSIGDNRSGGWYAYRASKAALNMLIRTLAIELARRAPEAVCVGLHPGTVDTPLAAPWHGSVPAGRLFTPKVAAANLLNVLDGRTPADSGGVFAWDGDRIPD